MYEIFKPRDGKPVFKTRRRWLANLIAWWIKGDFAMEGEGWMK